MIQVPRLGLWVASVACIVSFASVPTWADFAPDSIGGMVYRDTYFVPSIRTGYERTIIFEPSGRFIWVKEAGLFTVSENFAQGRFLLRAPRSDGTYVYSKTTPSSANVALTFDDASDPLVLYLGFTSPTGGALGNPIHPDLSFTLTEQATIRSAPAVNISTRGVVTPGHPMIVGFVVPGTPVSEYSDHVTSPHANRRDVLIRAVGPSLAAFGVANVCANPDFALHRSDGPSYLGPFSPFQFHYPDWSSIERPDAAGPRTRSPNPAGMAAFKKIFAQVGAFPLLDDSNDAAAVVRLAPGAYTVVATAGANDAGGEILVEVYFLP